MAITVNKTISCDGPNCKHTVAYDAGNESKVLHIPGNEWLKTIRYTNTFDQRTFCYCSDLCEIEAIKSGVHNPPVEKKTVEGTPQQVAAAIRDAEVAKQAKKAMKEGSGLISL